MHYLIPELLPPYLWYRRVTDFKQRTPLTAIISLDGLLRELSCLFGSNLTRKRNVREKFCVNFVVNNLGVFRIR